MIPDTAEICNYEDTSVKNVIVNLAATQRGEDYEGKERKVKCSLCWWRENGGLISICLIQEAVDNSITVQYHIFLAFE
jgi:hypothetical protein